MTSAMMLSLSLGISALLNFDSLRVLMVRRPGLSLGSSRCLAHWWFVLVRQGSVGVSWTLLERAKFPLVFLIIFSLLLSLIGPISLLAVAATTVNRGTHSATTFQTSSDTISFDSPVVSAADAAAGAIIVAQVVARNDSSVSNIWICPLQSGWTEITRAAESSSVIQQLWWRPVTSEQSASTLYAFESRSGGCDAADGEVTSMAGGMTVYTGVDTTSPIGEVVSSAGTTAQSSGSAPATTMSHVAGSRVARFIGTARRADISSDDTSRIYTISSGEMPRSAAAFDALLNVDGLAAAFPVSLGGSSWWVASTVVLVAESTSTEPTDTTPPQTTAYAESGWIRGSATVTLNAEDGDGSGVKEIIYSASGAQAIAETAVSGATYVVVIDTEGVTTVEFASRDMAGNLEEKQHITVRIDRTAPLLTGTPTTAPNDAGWYRDSVTISWSCSDELSGVSGECPSDSVISGDGSGLTASVSVADLAGNQTTSSVTGINIDGTSPVTTAVSSSEWSDEPVTVSLFAEDALSGVAATYFTVNDGLPQVGNSVVISESGTHDVAYWSVDVAGNVEERRTVSVRVDTIDPSITHTLSTPANEHGWHRAPVTVTFECSDSPSGIESCTLPQELPADGAGQIVTGTAIDGAGNRATDSVTLNIDQTPPTIVAKLTPEPDASGWASSSVVVSFECGDLLSGIASCPDPVTLDEGASQRVVGIATDLAGNTSSVSVDGLNVDLTPPTISANATTPGDQPYVSGTWVNQSVTVTFTCADDLSSIASCPVAQTVGDGAGQSVSGTAFDVAGNNASVTFDAINVDQAAPTISAELTTADGAVYTPGTWAGQAVTATFVCDDGLSGVATCSSQQLLGEGANQTVYGSVTDHAGNTTSLTLDDIDIDLTAPTIVATATTGDGNTYVPGTWTNQTVTIAFECDDSGSGLAGACPAPVIIDTSTAPEGRPVSAQVGDRAGLVASSPIILVKVDKDAPVFTSVPDDQVVEAVSDLGAPVSWVPPVVQDAIVGALTPDCSSLSGATFALGETVVTCTATDPAGNTASVDFTIRVVDTQPPELNLPEAIVVPADSPAGAIVTYDIGAADVRVASLPECTPQSGSHFPVGTTSVTCSATDGAGNTATAGFVVTVVGTADLLKLLRADTITLVTSRSHERALLRPLERAETSLQAGQTMRAYAFLIQYRMQVALYGRFGLLPPSVSAQLQSDVQQVTNAMF